MCQRPEGFSDFQPRKTRVTVPEKWRMGISESLLRDLLRAIAHFLTAGGKEALEQDGRGKAKVGEVAAS